MTEIRTTSRTGGQKGMKPERFDLIPTGALTQLAQHYGAGAEKYDDNQWRNGYEWSKSYAALQRHPTAWWSGQDIDEETGSSHMAAVAWHAFTLLTFIDEHPDFDDRYRASAGWLREYATKEREGDESHVSGREDEIMTDMELAEVSAAKNLVLAVLGDFDLPDEFDGIEAAERIVTNLIAGGVLIPEWMPDPMDHGRPAQGYYPTASQTEAWAGRAVTPVRVTGR